jgi:hypothetical protein
VLSWSTCAGEETSQGTPSQPATTSRVQALDVGELCRQLRTHALGQHGDAGDRSCRVAHVDGRLIEVHIAHAQAQRLERHAEKHQAEKHQGELIDLNTREWLVQQQ